MNYFYYICYQFLYIHIHTHTDIRVCMLIYRGGAFLEYCYNYTTISCLWLLYIFRVFQIAIEFCIFICMWVQIYSHAYNISGVILFYIFICIRVQVYSYAYNILGSIFIWECFDLWAPICGFLVLIEYLAIN